MPPPQLQPPQITPYSSPSNSLPTIPNSQTPPQFSQLPNLPPPNLPHHFPYYYPNPPNSHTNTTTSAPPPIPRPIPSRPPQLPYTPPPITTQLPPLLPPPIPSQALPEPAKPPLPPLHRLTPAQMMDRKSWGLCFNGNDKFHRGHICTAKLFLLVATNEEYDDPGIPNTGRDSEPVDYG